MSINIVVIIVTYNGYQWIDKCLDSLRNSTIPLFTVVIDNKSTDNTAEYIQGNYPEVNILTNDENLGFGKANNIGLKIAIEKDADYVFLLNQDAWIEKDTLEKLVLAHNSNEHFGIISPVHLNGTGTHLDDNFSKCLSQNVYENIISNLGNRKTKAIYETDFVNAAAWLIPIKCLLKVGGFDPLFSHYGEDRDYYNRVIFHKFRVGVLSNVYIYHDRYYTKDNPFRKQRNILFAVGLSHLKNISKSLFANYFTLVLQRIKKMVKAVLMFDFSTLINEVVVLFKLSTQINEISRSRVACKTVDSIYL